MSLSFKAKMGFIGVEIQGKATVDDRLVIIELEIPSILSSFVKEVEIRGAITTQTSKLLTDPPPVKK